MVDIGTDIHGLIRLLRDRSRPNGATLMEPAAAPRLPDDYDPAEYGWRPVHRARADPRAPELGPHDG